MVPKWQIFGDFWVLHFQQAACSTFQTLHSKFALSPTMCGSMVDIQSPTAEIRRGQKRKKEEEKNRAKMSWPVVLHRAAIMN